MYKIYSLITFIVLLICTSNLVSSNDQIKIESVQNKLNYLVYKRQNSKIERVEINEDKGSESALPEENVPDSVADNLNQSTLAGDQLSSSSVHHQSVANERTMNDTDQSSAISDESNQSSSNPVDEQTTFNSLQEENEIDSTTEINEEISNESNQSSSNSVDEQTTFNSLQEENEFEATTEINDVISNAGEIDTNQRNTSEAILQDIVASISSLNAQNMEIETLLNKIESIMGGEQANSPSMSAFQIIQGKNKMVVNNLLNLLETITYSEDGESFSSPQIENIRTHLLQLEQSSKLITTVIEHMNTELSGLDSEVSSLKQQTEELKSMVHEVNRGYKSVEYIFLEFSSTKHKMEEILHEIKQVRLQG